MNQQPKQAQTLLLILIALLVLAVISSSLLTQNGSRLAYSEVLDLFAEERVESFVLQGDTLTLSLRGNGTEDAGSATAKIGDVETFHKDLDETIAAQSAAGVPFSAATLQCTGDVITDLMEDLAAEQKARTTYDNILRLVDDPDVREPIKFLREREVVHFQRFGDALRITQDNLDAKNFYAFNPAFDKCDGKSKNRGCGCGR